VSGEHLQYSVANISRTINTKILSESAWFCRRCDKKHLVCFGFAIPIAIHLQNANAKFHKAV